MTPARTPPFWPAPLIAALALIALYAGALGVGFLNDSYLFLEEARMRPLLASLTRLGPLGNFYRPLSRQLYFAALTPVAGGHPLVFHVVNAALFFAALALLFDLLRSLAPRHAAMAGTLCFALLPFQRVNLMWISCSQDLLALVSALGAIALHRRGRRGLAVFATLAAVASKEAALPVPVALAAWDRLIAGRDWRTTRARVWPAALAVAGWCGVLLRMRALDPEAAAFLRFGPGDFLAGLAHEAQSLIGLDHPAGIARGLLARAPAPLPLALLAALAWWMPVAPRGAPGAPARALVRFALVWLLAFGLVTGPVAHSWSSYYYTLSAVGGAMLVAAACFALDRVRWLALCAGLLWLHAGSGATTAFSIVDRPWTWTSHLNSFYFERAGALTDTLARDLRALEPAPPRGTRFFFATLPPFAGFQMGNGPLVRALYRDPTLVSHFFSRYSDSTASDHPVRFFYWDGARLRPLYDRTRDPLFQVGTDLLLLDRPAGAAHAFRRGLEAGGDPRDHLYWLGWAELWRGDRAAAEAAWRAWGAADDSVRWWRHLRMAETALDTDRDTLLTRRLLLEAIRSGIGRPEAHAVLGALLARSAPKYAALETRVAVWLKPDDWLARRDLIRQLVAARLDDRARAELAALDLVTPDASADPAIAEARAILERRSGARSGVIEF